MAEKTYTARQLAERFDVAGSTVRGWLLRGLLQGAHLKETELGDSYWVVPESALKDFTPPKPGPVPKTQPAETTRGLNDSFKKSAAGKKRGAKK
jgi:hypothetical protein